MLGKEAVFRWEKSRVKLMKVMREKIIAGCVEI